MSMCCVNPFTRIDCLARAVWQAGNVGTHHSTIEEKYGIAESEIKTLKLFVIMKQDGAKVRADDTFVL